MGNIYLSVNADNVLGGVSKDAAVILSCKTSPSLIDAINSQVSSSIGRATTDSANSQQPMSLIDTSTCAATCSRCGTYVGDGQIVDREGEEESVPNKGNFSLRDLSNIRFIRHRVQWSGGRSLATPSSGAALLLSKQRDTEQVLSHLLTAASSLFGSSTFELYVPDVPR